jgi:hypothetical protein
MIIGSAGDAGSKAGVDRFVGIIKDLAAEHDLPEFTIGYFYSDIEPARLTARHRRRHRTRRARRTGDPLTLADVDATDAGSRSGGRRALHGTPRDGRDVIIGGRSSDCAVFAAAALHEGIPADLAFYLGKVLECASFCAEPYGGKETVIGEVGPSWVDVTAMADEQRCTPASVASHAMYERSHPYFEAFAGGMIDMTGLRLRADRPQDDPGHRLEGDPQRRVQGQDRRGGAGRCPLHRSRRDPRPVHARQPRHRDPGHVTRWRRPSAPTATNSTSTCTGGTPC